MASEWSKVRELFGAALDQSDPHAWLQRQQIDSTVRREVVSLLDNHSRAGSFMLESIVDRVPDLLGEDEALESGAVVGHYKVEREIGRGAMGRVYLAVDTKLGRRVALKALAPHLTGDSSTGTLATMDVTFGSELDGSAIRRLRRGPILINENRRLSIHRFEVLVEPC